MFVKPYLFGALTLLSASSALALTCANDYGSSAGCASNTTAAGDCATLGYSKDNVDGCEHYLYCPFDTSYKRCVASEKIDCSDYPFEECPEGAKCSSCNNGTSLMYKVDSCDASNGYVFDGKTCFYMCSYIVFDSVDSLPKHVSDDEWWSGDINGVSYVCFDGCGYNYEDGYDTYDPVKNECLPTDCCGQFGKDLCVEAPSWPANADLECKSADTMYYSCPGISINGTWQKATYDKATNTCNSCPELGYNLSECPQNTICDKCVDAWGNEFYKDTLNCKENGYTLDKCPTGGKCSACGVGDGVTYKLDSCESGFAQSGDSCRVARCSDYGYSTLDNGARVCKNKHSVKSGTTYLTCYSGCASCSSLNVYSFDSASQACSYFYKQGYRNLCLKNNAVSERGYPYGQCYRYEMDGAVSASACRYIWCPDYGY